MPDTAPGNITDAYGWPGRWETITRGEYHRLIAEAGGRDALAVASGCTRVDEGYFLTAWARKGCPYPLVQSEFRSCDNSLPPARYAECPGEHTFCRFIYDPALDEDLEPEAASPKAAGR